MYKALHGLAPAGCSNHLIKAFYLFAVAILNLEVTMLLCLLLLNFGRAFPQSSRSAESVVCFKQLISISQRFYNYSLFALSFDYLGCVLISYLCIRLICMYACTYTCICMCVFYPICETCCNRVLISAIQKKKFCGC